MPTYEFSAVLKSPTALTEDLANRLFAIGCDDATPSSSDGVVAIEFSRDANHLETAICAAVANAQKSGCVLRRSTIEDQLGVQQAVR
jgi:hypothetical protein